MAKVFLPQFNMTLHSFEGETVLDVFKRCGIMFDAPCGGNKRCKNCRVTVFPLSECECKKFLPSNEYERGVRLACFYKINNDCSIILNSEAGKNKLVEQGKAKLQNDGQIAVADVGTTTLALSVYDKNKKEINSVFSLNPQKLYGADVISRINACNEGKLEVLNSLITSAIEAHLSGAKKIYIAANTAMLHIFANVDPRTIGQAPYTPVFTETRRIVLSNSLNTEAVLMPSAGAFIGADAVAGVLSCGMYEKNENSLLVDLGTNGEIVLKYNGRYFATSAAAGPAFEGGNISCGTYSSESAVSSAFIDENQKIVLDKKDAFGICGAGLIDLLACLLKCGRIDGSGRIENNESEIRVDNIVLTQKDIRELQLAKASVCASIKTLLKSANAEETQISTVYLAGGLGKGLNTESATIIGLLPTTLGAKTRAVGNTALKGAQMCALDESNLKICEQIAKSITLVELTCNPLFFDFYTQEMAFYE